MRNEKLKAKIKDEVISTIMMLVAVIVSFTSLWIFVLPAQFAPSGIDGVSMILNVLTGVNPGWFKLIINVPLMVLALIFLKPRYVIYVIVFTLIDSLGLIVLENVEFYQYPVAELGLAGRIMASLASGVALGVCTGIMIKIGCSTGGVDIVACLVVQKKPHIKIEKIISFICYGIIFCSFFVYWDVNSVLLSFIQIVVFEVTSSLILKTSRYAVEVKIVTKEPDKIRDEIINNLNHSATVVESTGMYTNDKNYVVMTVINSLDIHKFMEVMKQHPETFIYFSDGVRVQGDFHYNRQITSVTKEK